jgi:ABC-type transporter Mla subunit MlaD
MSRFGLRRRDEIPVVELRRYKPLRSGIILLVVVAIAVYFGFTKHIPFTHGYRLNAVFTSALNIHTRSPVRIAGVNVGQVTSVRREGRTGVVSMEIEAKGLPIHEDATLKIRPRLFLEGNFFVDLQPGSPSAPTVPSGHTIPITQTANPVQIDQVLSALDSDTRTNLQIFLREYGEALRGRASAAEEAEQSPDVRGLNAAQALNKAYQRGPEALRYTAILNQALAGTEPHDLSKLIAGLESFSGALNVHEQQLGELLDNFDVFLGSFAAQSSSLRAAIAQLPGALHTADRAFTEVSGALGPTRTFSLALIPGVEEGPATIQAALPWIEQTRASLAPNELGGVATNLRAAAPVLAGLVGGQSSLLSQNDLLSRCFTKVVFPAGETKIQDGASSSGVPAYQEFWNALVGVNGAAQSFDGNGVFQRILAIGGGSTIVTPQTKPLGSPARGFQLAASTALSPLGTRPRYPGVRPPYKPLVPCYTQALPEFNGPLSNGPADGSGG